MSAMDFKSKGKTLVGNICHKFESIFHEVDNLISEDTVEYMENHVQSVDRNLKQYYPGFANDLIPPSSHPTKRKAQPVVWEINAVRATCTEPMVESSGSDPVDDQLAHGINELQIVNQDLTQISADSLENPMSDSTQRQFDDNELVTSINREEFHSPEKEGLVYDDFADIYDSSQMDFSVLSSEKKITKMGLKSSINRTLSLESYTSVESLLADRVSSCNDLIDVAQSGSEQPDDALQHFASALLVSSNSTVAKNGLVTSSNPLPLEGPLTEYYEEISESEMETIDLCDNVKLEDICIFADDSELYAVSRRTQKLRSYKKKIQDAFSSRKRLAKEYQQIAIWYGDTDVGSSQDTSRSLMPTITSAMPDSENSSVQDLSDWELL